MAEEVIIDGNLIDTPNEGYQDHQTANPDFKEWLAIEVPVEASTGKQKWVDITKNFKADQTF